MNGIGEFLIELVRQREFLDSCREIDDIFGDISSARTESPWPDRKLTRQDLNRRELYSEMFDQCPYGQPPTTWKSTVKGRVSTRTETAFKVFPLSRMCETARRAAIKFCQQHPEFIADEPVLIRKFAQVHDELLEFTRQGFDGAAVTCEMDWQICRRELELALSVIEEADPEIEAGKFLNENPAAKVGEVLRKFEIDIPERTWRDHLKAKGFTLNSRRRGKKLQNGD